jgi:hypothetical protein
MELQGRGCLERIMAYADNARRRVHMPWVAYTQTYRSNIKPLFPLPSVLNSKFGWPYTPALQITRSHDRGDHDGCYIEHSQLPFPRDGE